VKSPTQRRRPAGADASHRRARPTGHGSVAAGNRRRAVGVVEQAAPPAAPPVAEAAPAPTPIPTAG